MLPSKRHFYRKNSKPQGEDFEHRNQDKGNVLREKIGRLLQEHSFFSFQSLLSLPSQERECAHQGFGHILLATDEYEGGLALYSCHDSLFTGRFLTPSGTILLSDGDNSSSRVLPNQPQEQWIGHFLPSLVSNKLQKKPTNSVGPQTGLLLDCWGVGGQSLKVNSTLSFVLSLQTVIFGYWGRLIVVMTTFTPTSCFQAFGSALPHHCWRGHVS